LIDTYLAILSHQEKIDFAMGHSALRYTAFLTTSDLAVQFKK